MIGIILDENYFTSHKLDNASTVAKSHENEYAYQQNETCHAVPINQYGNCSIYIENTNYSDIEKIKVEYNIKALERHILSLLKEGNTLEAKSIIKEFKNYSSPLIDKWKIALSRSPKRENRTASLKKNEIELEYQLIGKYKNSLASQWVAIGAGKMIAANTNLLELKNEIKSLGIIDEVTFIKL